VSRLRVLQLITSLAGGAGLYAWQLARHLDAARFESVIAYGPGYPLDARVAQERLAHRELRWTRAAGLASSAAGALDVWRVLRAGRYDIVHTHCSLAGAVGRPLARLAHARSVFTVHAFASHEHQPPLRRRLLLGAERLLDRWTDAYCVTTEAFRRELIERRIAAAERIEVIALGIDPPAPPDPAARRRARAALGIEEGQRAIFAAGRFEPQKGFDLLLDAFERVHCADGQARLVLFGSGPLEEALRARAARAALGHAVRFPGWRDDYPAFLAGADLYCLSSRWEAFGYVLLDAMAAGVPIVATRVGGVPEVLHGGRYGTLVEPGDPAALAAALAAALHPDPARRPVLEEARRRVASEYSLGRMIERHAGLYERLAGERHAGARSPRGGYA
jgi:glycosyltransferase involved in cell wall biosynthesis